MTLEEAKAAHVRVALAMMNGRVAQAAKLLGVDRRTMYRMLKRYGIEHERQRRGKAPSPSAEAP